MSQHVLTVTPSILVITDSTKDGDATRYEITMPPKRKGDEPITYFADNRMQLSDMLLSIIPEDATDGEEV